MTVSYGRNMDLDWLHKETEIYEGKGRAFFNVLTLLLCYCNNDFM